MGWRTDFIVLDADAPARQQLATLATAPASWVLVQRAGGRWRYVFSRDEVLSHRRLLALLEALGVDSLLDVLGHVRADKALGSATLTEMLDLHESQSSLQRRPDGARVGEFEAGGAASPSAQREVQIDDHGQPEAVGGADVPSERRTRSVARGAPAPSLEATPPPVPATATRGRRAARAPTAPDDASRDEGTTPVRYPSIEPTAALQPGEPVTLVIDLTRQAATNTAGGALDLGQRQATWQTLSLGVTLAANGIDFDGGGRGEVTIRRNADSIAARCSGRVQAGLAPGSEIEVSAQFWDGTRCCGAAKRVLGVAQAPTRTRSRGSPVTQVATATSGQIRVEPDAEKPDLTVYITQFPAPASGMLHWRMETAHFDDLPPKLDGFIDLGRDTAVEAAAMFKQFANLERGKHRARIEGFGEKLWDRAPGEFRECYWALHDHYRRALTIQFCSDDPHLPWELMRPYRKNEVHPPLALRHAVARWIGRYQGYFRNDLPAGELLTIAPRYKSASTRLSLAEETAAMLGKRFGARAVGGTREAIRLLLEEPGDKPVALLYFTGHGLFNSELADASAIKLEDGNLAVDEVARRETRLGERWGTLVFFNACEVGATGSAFGTVGGWANAFASRRFRAFIAPLWAIDEEDASRSPRN